MTKKRILALLLAAVTALGLAACNNGGSGSSAAGESGAAGSKTAEEEPINDQVLVVGVSANFSEKWNPFLSESTYDREVTDQIFVPVLQKNESNELVPYAGSITSEEQADGVLYTVKLNEGMVFSDGEPITIEDYIYRLYVHADPSFTGAMSLLPVPIEGMKEYYYDDPNYSAKVAEFEKTAQEQYSPETITFENFLEFAKDTAVDGTWDPAAIEDIKAYIEGEGEEYKTMLAGVDAANPDEVLKIYAQVEYDLYRSGYDTAGWYLNKQKQGYAAGNLSDGVDVPEISGVKKIDDLTCTVKYTTVDIYADRTLGETNGIGNLAPEHYYGEFAKGDVSKQLANMVPLGSGPYKWESYSDNIATLTANPKFFLGEPKIGTVRWQYIPQDDMISSIASGTIDIFGPDGISMQYLDELKAVSTATYSLVDNAGYGYMGLNCESLPLEVRKGILCLMNRQPAVEGYYGTELATVIERPMTTVLAEYPQDAKPYYTYSRDEALKHFEAAGYTQKDGKLVDANGNQLVVNAYVGGEGKGNHPSYAMFVQAAEDMRALGGELQIQDVTFQILMSAMDDGTADLFTLAWSEVNTCDKTDQFASTGGQNKFRFKDAKMDDMLKQILATLDLTERKKLVSEMLDYAIDNCIEFPLYQRKNTYAYNNTTVNMETIPEATAFYSYKNELWKVELN